MSEPHRYADPWGQGHCGTCHHDDTIDPDGWCCRFLDNAEQRAERAEAKLAEVLKKKNDMGAELARLREALEEIAAARNWTIHIECFGVVMRLADRARAALTQENPDDE